MGQPSEQILLYRRAIYCKERQLLLSHLAIDDGCHVSELGAALAIGSVAQRDSPACPGGRASPVEVPLSPQFSAANLFTL